MTFKRGDIVEYHHDAVPTNGVAIVLKPAPDAFGKFYSGGDWYLLAWISRPEEAGGVSGRLFHSSVLTKLGEIDLDNP